MTPDELETWANSLLDGVGGPIGRRMEVKPMIVTTLAKLVGVVERRCMADVCWACKQDLPIVNTGKCGWVHTDGRNYSEQCLAGNIRARMEKANAD